MMVTHLGEIFQLTNSRLEAIGTNRRLRSLTSEIIPDADTVTYTYKIREALPGRTSHSDAITSRYGVTLEQMLSALAARGLPVSPDNPAWNGLKGGFTHE